MAQTSDEGWKVPRTKMGLPKQGPEEVLVESERGSLTGTREGNGGSRSLTLAVSDMVVLKLRHST